MKKESIIFVSYKTSDKITVGFGAYVPYAGGGVDWKREQLGTPFKSYMGIYTLTPIFAYQVSNNLSLGFNLNFYHTPCGQPLIRLKKRLKTFLSQVI